MKRWAQDYFREMTIKTASVLLDIQGELLKIMIKSGSYAVPLSFHVLEQTGLELFTKGGSAIMYRSDKRIRTRNGVPVVSTGGILVRKKPKGSTATQGRLSTSTSIAGHL